MYVSVGVKWIPGHAVAHNFPMGYLPRSPIVWDTTEVWCENEVLQAFAKIYTFFPFSDLSPSSFVHLHNFSESDHSILYQRRGTLLDSALSALTREANMRSQGVCSEALWFQRCVIPLNIQEATEKMLVQQLQHLRIHRAYSRATGKGGRLPKSLLQNCKYSAHTIPFFQILQI